jgi:[ribosomal protein S5]-alanine N-acetyltransferase
MSVPPIATIPTLSKLPLVIETARLRLRPPTEADAEAIFAFAKDPELPRFMSWGAHVTVDETRDWMRACVANIEAGTDMLWIIEHGGAPVGCIGLDGITWTMRALRKDTAELGYWIAPSLHGQGFMTEAATAVTSWAFERLGLHKVTVSCFEGNEGSRRVIEKMGFRYYGRQEEDVWRDGRWYAHLRYELTATEWGDATRTLRFSRPV